MKTEMRTTLLPFLALTLTFTMTTTLAYTYAPYPTAPTTQGTINLGGVQQPQVDSVDRYLAGLLQYLGITGRSPYPSTQQEPASRPYDAVQQSIEAIQQRSEDDEDDDDDDDDEEDNSVVGYVPPITTTTTTTTPSTTTTPVYVRPTTTTPTTTTTTTTTTTRPTTTTTTTPRPTTTTPTTSTTTTTTPVPVTHRPLQNLCDNCTFQHGIGYHPHPSDCTLYIQCRLNDRGVPVVDSVRPCPHGLYWNQHKLTCDFQENVRCTDDICLGYKKLKRSAATCRGFWDCTSGSAVAKCCAHGFAFNPMTSNCQYQPSCSDDCLDSSQHTQYHCEGMRGVPGDRTKYEVQTAVDTWVRMPCAPGTAFSYYPCGCTALLNQPTGQVCTPELYLPFNSDTTDQSGLDTWVQNEGVIVKDGKAFFDGKSRLVVPRFSNAWWGATVYIHLRYKSLNGGYFGHKQTLVSNGDCEASPSLSMCAGNRGVEFFAATTDSYQPANITVPSGTSLSDGWNEVLYKLDDNLLQGYVNDQKAQAQALGNLETRHCGLVIGGGTTCQNFDGVMDDVVVYLCRPYIK